jgi:hypothetical protein
MAPLTTTEVVDRHALVLTIWLSAGLIAATLFHYGLGTGGPLHILAAFGVVIAGFAGHVIVNVVVGAGFTVGELALGLVLYGTALIAFGCAALVSHEFVARAALPSGLGFLAIFAAVVFYMIVHSGVRGAFEAFDAIRSFRARDQIVHGEAGSARE